MSKKQNGLKGEIHLGSLDFYPPLLSHNLPYVAKTVLLVRS